MQKIGLDIVGLSYSQTQSGAYALVLAEQEGKRRLPIIIGGFEAQAIAIELEDMTPSRPLTHDLFKNFADSFAINIEEVIIYNLVEGIFYAKLICVKDGKTTEIDTRTSDAVALAVRFKCPIYTYEFILENAGIILEEDAEEKEAETSSKPKPKKKEKKGIDSLNMAELRKRLDNAIETENYEEASRLRDEIQRRSESNN
ncbi:MAG: bifunctional nuclease family protein [Vicingaceae bacterium]